eukprot:1138547-Pelagomonas_calceolata.AAC.6
MYIASVPEGLRYQSSKGGKRNAFFSWKCLRWLRRTGPRNPQLTFNMAHRPPLMKGLSAQRRPERELHVVGQLQVSSSAAAVHVVLSLGRLESRLRDAGGWGALVRDGLVRLTMNQQHQSPGRTQGMAGGGRFTACRTHGAPVQMRRKREDQKEEVVLAGMLQAGGPADKPLGAGLDTLTQIMGSIEDVLLDEGWIDKFMNGGLRKALFGALTKNWLPAIVLKHSPVPNAEEVTFLLTHSSHL